MADQNDSTRNISSGENLTLEQQIARMTERMEANEQWMAEMATENYGDNANIGRGHANHSFIPNYGRVPPMGQFSLISRMQLFTPGNTSREMWQYEKIENSLER
ncbi:hypothetical protein TorRG33x02_102290 [Trema orientale]|uniref:Uncharacterized protein n=1 Tax=Trema orientale TaxID=63057 RepID=A0A2P5F7V5_TREOI|nr:hypothetical protein TorRG33x02_102290 [Trema orientale]